MRYFTTDYLEFFKELAANNHKDWFDTNRKRYEIEVREPFKRFITELITSLAKRDADLKLEAKEAIFRINRDIRFSKDKTPYKLNNSAIISAKGRKDKNYPGIYLELGPERLSFYGGIYMPDPKLTQRIRTFLRDYGKEFKALLNEDIFKDEFGQMQGDKNKRIPAEFRDAAEIQPLLMNKQWYYFSHYPADTVLSDGLIDLILDLDRKAGPMKNFLIRAVQYSR